MLIITWEPFTLLCIDGTEVAPYYIAIKLDGVTNSVGLWEDSYTNLFLFPTLFMHTYTKIIIGLTWIYLNTEIPYAIEEAYELDTKNFISLWHDFDI